MRHLHECSLESVTEQKQEFTSTLSNRCSGNLRKFPVQQIQRNLFYHKVAGLQPVILQKAKCNQKYFWINKNYLKTFFVTIHTDNIRTYLFIFTYLLIWLFRVSQVLQFLPAFIKFLNLRQSSEFLFFKKTSFLKKTNTL